ncbi:MAG: protein kinase [Chloroflexota bacterium]
MTTDSLIGRTVGRYKIVERLGRGGMAEVFKAYQAALDRYVAIKVMHPFLSADPDFLSRFQREAKAMAALNHPNIVSVYDFDVQDNNYYIVMEFIGGGTLKDRLAALAERGERMSLAEAVRLILEIADALAYAHARGMVHRDIKPGNIMLTEEGKAELTDFGIARILSGPSYTMTGATMGTPAYMSPEQGLGRPSDERSDIYALGVLFFQLVTGRLPFDADTPVALMLKHVHEPVPTPTQLNPQLPAAVQTIVLRAMAKEPAARYQTAHEMARAIREGLAAADAHLVAALPPELLQDRPTPTPSGLSTGRQPAAGSTDPTQVMAARPRAAETMVAGADQTRIARGESMSQTEVMLPAFERPPAAVERKKRPLWLWLGGLGVVAVLAAVVVLGMALAGANREEVTPAVESLATMAVTAAGPPTHAAPPADTTATPDKVATELAGIVATLNAPTGTPASTATIPPVTPSSTPDASDTALAACIPRVEMVDYYTYQNRSLKGAPVGARFPMNWILRNSGSCPWPAGLQWRYVEGEDWQREGPVTLLAEVPAGEEMTITTFLTAPAAIGRYESSWQLMSTTGDPFGQSLTFALTTYILASPTPDVTATPTGIPTATPTPVQVVNLSFTWGLRANSCAYRAGTPDWECIIDLSITGVGPFRAFVQDLEYQGPGNLAVTIHARRCDPWVQEIRLIDDGTGQQQSQNAYVDPDTLTFPGGPCVPA